MSSSLPLPDGRSLSYVDLGAADGPVVLVLDGPGSRGLARAAARAAGDLDLGIRLIAPDRPGFLGSTAVDGKSFAGVAADLLVLADRLGLERFGLLGQSGGTPYALALAAAAGDRVTGLAFCGALSPLGEADAMQDVGGPMKVPFTLARRAPVLLSPLMKAGARQVRKDPKKAAQRFAAGLPSGDRAVLDRPEYWAIHEEETGSAIADPAAFAHEARMLAQPWDIDLAAITAPVAFWVGERDLTHPPVMSRRMAQRLGGAPVHVVPDAATFGLLERYPDALAFATRR
jgi:pimeloyl-ACP methyl ester carboxylesterase